MHPALWEELERRETVVFKVNYDLNIVEHVNPNETFVQAFLEHPEETDFLESRVAREKEASSVLREIKVCLDQSDFKETRVIKASQDLMV